MTYMYVYKRIGLWGYFRHVWAESTPKNKPRKLARVIAPKKVREKNHMALTQKEKNVAEAKGGRLWRCQCMTPLSSPWPKDVRDMGYSLKGYKRSWVSDHHQLFNAMRSIAYYMCVKKPL